jgi:hypothetical protein
MTTLFVRRVGSQRSKLTMLGGLSGRWAVSDGDTELATARDHFSRPELDIDADGRQLTARMPGKIGRGKPPREFEVVDDRTGEKLADGTRVWDARTKPRPTGEEWDVALASGSTISWFYMRDPDKLGFYDNGAPVLRIGNDPSFDVPAKASTFRILLRMWGGAIRAAGRYAVQVEDSAVGRVVPAEDVPVLALVAMWLKKNADVRYSESDLPS